MLFQIKRNSKPSLLNIPVEWAYVAKGIYFSIAKEKGRKMSSYANCKQDTICSGRLRVSGENRLPSELRRQPL